MIGRGVIAVIRTASADAALTIAGAVRTSAGLKTRVLIGGAR